MKVRKILALCLCTVVLLSTTACNITRSAKNLNLDSSYETSSVVSSSTILNSVSSDMQTSSSSVSSVAVKESSAPAVFEAGTKEAESWVAKAPMSMARFDFGSAVVGEKIYAIGGLTTDDYHDTTSVEAYEPKTNQWQKRKPMPTSRIIMQTAVLDGKIYVAGGSEKGTGEKVATIERYDPAADTWVELKPISINRAAFKLAVLDGKLYVIGGVDEKNSQTVSSVEAYDPISNIWAKKASMLSPKQGFEIEIVNGKIYIIGGSCLINRIPHSLATMEMYDPKINQWTNKPSMKTVRDGFRAETVDGKIYVIGGVIPNSDGGTDAGYLTSVEEYNPASDKWTMKASMKQKKNEFQTAVLNGKIYVIGGYKDIKYANQADNFLASVEEYNLKTNTWTDKNPLKTGRRNFETSIVDGSVYAIGGTVGPDAADTGTASVEEYTATK